MAVLPERAPGKRRRLCAMAAIMAVFAPPCAAMAQTAQRTSPSQVSASLPVLSHDDFLDIRTYALRTDDPDGATLTVFTPQYGHQSGAAVIIAPGGAYISLAGNLEGRQAADWFAARGVTAFVLRYRHGAGHPLPQALEDGERAVRFVRANALALGVDADRIGMMGFSAGGHVSAMTVTLSDDGDPDAASPIERVSSRPDFLVLAYPGLEVTQPGPGGGSRYCAYARLARWDCDARDYVAYTPFDDIAGKAPPTFIFHTTDDRIVPVGESLRLYTLLANARVDVEAHFPAHGVHRSGLGGADPSLSIWPQALEAWLRARGYLDRRAAGGGA